MKVVQGPPDTIAMMLGTAPMPREHYIIDGGAYHIEIVARPSHCDRGRWIATISAEREGAEIGFPDRQEGWPRYYFDIYRALDEIGDWLITRMKA